MANKPAAVRPPVIEFYWQRNPHPMKQTVNVRFIAANGEQVAQNTQGYTDVRDARRGVDALLRLLGGDLTKDLKQLEQAGNFIVRGPGPKSPKP